jgi:hypothetical protein
MALTGQGSNPLSVLNSYHSGVQYELVEEGGPPHDRHFVFKVEVLGVAYTGMGSSKKRAKHAAAAAALRSVYNINLSLGMEAAENGGGGGATSGLGLGQTSGQTSGLGQTDTPVEGEAGMCNNKPGS